MKTSLPSLCYIAEQTSFTEDYQDKFGYHMVEEKDRFYIIFEAILQSFGVLNRNGRMYDAMNIMECIKTDPYIITMLENNCWMGELEHPTAIYENQNLSITRLATVMPANSSHYIRQPRLEGNLLKATIQTDSSNPSGMNLAKKIVDGKIIPGFSARVLGELKTRGGQPLVDVKKLITYDYVLFPSHKEALGNVNRSYNESGVNYLQKAINGDIIFFDELAKGVAKDSEGAQILCESFGLTNDDIIGVTSTGNSVVLKEKDNIYISPITNEIARKKTKHCLNDWLKNK